MKQYKQYKHYKHKQTGSIYDLETGYIINGLFKGNKFNKLFVIESQDWEEIKEADVFEKIKAEIHDHLAYAWGKYDSDMVVKIIKKNLGITNKELSEYLVMKGTMMNYEEHMKLGDVIDLFKKRGLYLDN